MGINPLIGLDYIVCIVITLHHLDDERCSHGKAREADWSNERSSSLSLECWFMQC